MYRELNIERGLAAEINPDDAGEIQKRTRRRKRDTFNIHKRLPPPPSNALARPQIYNTNGVVDGFYNVQ